MRHGIDGKDLLNVFGSETGKAVLKYLLKSYYHIPSHTRGDPYETAYNEGRRAVVMDILDKMGQEPGAMSALMAEICWMSDERLDNEGDDTGDA